MEDKLIQILNFEEEIEYLASKEVTTYFCINECYFYPEGLSVTDNCGDFYSYFESEEHWEEHKGDNGGEREFPRFIVKEQPYWENTYQESSVFDSSEYELPKEKVEKLKSLQNLLYDLDSDGLIQDETNLKSLYNQVALNNSLQNDLPINKTNQSAKLKI